MMRTLPMLLFFICVPVATLAGTISIDFEMPVLVDIDWLATDTYTDPASGVVFVAYSGKIGPVVNSATSACVDPPDRDQKLGTAASGDHPGGAGEAIFVYFPAPLQPPVRINVDVQSGWNSDWAITLFHPVGVEAGQGTRRLSTSGGNCGYPGGWRSMGTLTVTSEVPVAWAVIGPAPHAASSFVFVIDDMVIESPTLDTSVRNETVPWSAIKARYVR